MTNSRNSICVPRRALFSRSARPLSSCSVATYTRCPLSGFATRSPCNRNPAPGSRLTPGSGQLQSYRTAPYVAIRTRRRWCCPTARSDVDHRAQTGKGTCKGGSCQAWATAPSWRGPYGTVELEYKFLLFWTRLRPVSFSNHVCRWTACCGRRCPEHRADRRNFWVWAGMRALVLSRRYDWSIANVFAGHPSPEEQRTHIEDAHMWIASEHTSNPGSYREC